MRDLNGDNNGTIIDNSQTVISKGEYIYITDRKIEKEETTIGNIVKEKVIEAIVGGGFTGVAAIINYCKSADILNFSKQNLSGTLIVIMFTFYVIGIGLLLIFLYDILNILSLSRNGSFVEFESKVLWLNKLFEVFRNNEDYEKKRIELQVSAIRT